jgi:hypothetical protein
LPSAGVALQIENLAFFETVVSLQSYVYATLRFS